MTFHMKRAAAQILLAVMVALVVMIIAGVVEPGLAPGEILRRHR